MTSCAIDSRLNVVVSPVSCLAYCWDNFRDLVDPLCVVYTQKKIVDKRE